jgi:hypothetical protein
VVQRAGAPAVLDDVFFFLVSFHQNSSLGSACGCSSCFGCSFTLLTGLCYGDSCMDRWVRFLFFFIRACVCAHTCAHSCAHTCAHTCMYVHKRTHARARARAHTHAQTHRSRSLSTISICTTLLAHGLRLFRRQRRLRDREGRRGGGICALPPGQ